jgi:protein CpsH
LKNTKFSIAIFWDSIEKIPMQKKYLDKFDVIYSFEPDDCKKYHLKSITNFFFAESDSHNSLYDVCYLATFDDRIKETELIFKYFEENGISAKGQIFVHTPKKISIKNIEVIEKIIPFSKSYQFYLEGNIVLDIAHPHQKGLSFRPYEAMGLRKKLITTNKDIANYDFYNPNNIFIIDDVHNIHIPMDFITSNYQEVTPAIREKYHIKNWIKSILYGN